MTPHELASSEEVLEPGWYSFSHRIAFPGLTPPGEEAEEVEVSGSMEVVRPTPIMELAADVIRDVLRLADVDENDGDAYKLIEFSIAPHGEA